MGDIAIRAEELSKRYTIGAVQFRPDTLREYLASAVRGLFRRSGGSDVERYTIWALRDVSFEIKQGEVVGIIGSNGAGKSTLLKILSRITDPTAGRAVIYGRVGSLLEVGTGFHPDLTGRENIYLNGAVLNMKKAEIDHKFDEIVAFAEMEKFLDTPVKRYSSGMYVRLAFAVAAHLEPEILVVDEVLAVGDAAFRRKCLGKMGSVAKEGRTVLFVSHNMRAVRSLCGRGFLVRDGQIQRSGPVDEVVREYLALAYRDEPEHRSLLKRRNRSGTGNVRAVSFHARASDSKGGPPRTGASVEFVVEYATSRGHRLGSLYVGITVSDDTGTSVFTCSTSMTDSDFRDLPPNGEIICEIAYLPLLPGAYHVRLKLAEPVGQGPYLVADEIANAASFVVEEGGDSGFTRYANRETGGSIIVPHRWLCESPAQRD
jgi:lipopolysaccharide transport system ATP-binding protein